MQNPGKDCASSARPGSFQVRRRQIPVFTGMTEALCKGLQREREIRAVALSQRRPLQNPGKDCASSARPGSFQVRRRQIPVFTGMTEALCKGLQREREIRAVALSQRRPLQNPGKDCASSARPGSFQVRRRQIPVFTGMTEALCKGLQREREIRAVALSQRRPLQNPGKDCASSARPGSFQVRRRQIPVFTGMTEALCKGLQRERG